MIKVTLNEAFKDISVSKALNIAWKFFRVVFKVEVKVAIVLKLALKFC